jgi:hypothetical protein
LYVEGVGMVSAGFTPGPWKLTPHVSFGATHMYWVNGVTSVGTQVEADAHLIAAAPELYALCQRAANTFRAYEALHRAKQTPEGDEKAATNAGYAAEFEEVLAKATPATSDARPVSGGVE